MGNKDNQSSADLSHLRTKIDELDRKIVELLNMRAGIVVRIGKTKQTDGTPVYAPDREQAVLKRISELNKGPLPPKTLQAIYRELMSGSFLLEKPLRIGFLGPEGSFSHVAAVRKFGTSVEYLSQPDITAVFEEVSRGHCDLGIVPAENSVGGGVVETFDSFTDADQRIYICAEVYLEVHHNLLSRCGTENIKVIASKPEVFAQCRNWLAAHFRDIEMRPMASSAKAAEAAAKEDGLAAIGSTLAAELYDLPVVFANIEDRSNNVTRFFVISRKPAGHSGDDKTSIMFTTAHKAGALVEVLNILGKYGINMTNIDTRPSKRRNWEYFFFVDAEGHCDDENFAKALHEARQHCGELQILGSFPRAHGTV